MSEGGQFAIYRACKVDYDTCMELTVPDIHENILIKLFDKAVLNAHLRASL